KVENEHEVAPFENTCYFGLKKYGEVAAFDYSCYFRRKKRVEVASSSSRKFQHKKEPRKSPRLLGVPHIKSLNQFIAHSHDALSLRGRVLYNYRAFLAQRILNFSKFLIVLLRIHLVTHDQ